MYMKTRIISACVMLPLLILVYLGGWFIWAAALIVAVLGVREFYKGFEASGAKPCYPSPTGHSASLRDWRSEPS